MPARTLARTVPLASLTTLRVGGPAEVWTVNSLPALVEACEEPFRMIGAGSNLLVADRGVDHRVVQLGRHYHNLDRFEQDPSAWIGAATPLPGLVRRAQRLGLSGLEGLLGIPAVVGGAVAMNAGTRFGSIAEVVAEVELYYEREVVRLPIAALQPGYRTTTVPHGAAILGVRLELAPSTPAAVSLAMEAVDEARQGQPKVKSAGCAFKNPTDDSAGRLIDEAGLKGMRVGDAMVSLEHGNFIVNLGSATAHDVITLVAKIRQQVPVPLELEWRLWGF